MSKLFFDRAGNALGREMWLALFEDDDYRVIAVTQVTPAVRVSTVWTGIDHSHPTDDQYLIFETVIFREGRSEDRFLWATEEEAHENHHTLVEEERERAGLS